MKNIDWGNLSFGYIKTDYNVRCVYKDGKWGNIEVSDSEYINLHIAATSIHYGQEAFEGLKAYTCKDGKIKVFRWEENAKRMYYTAEGVRMAPVPVELFKEALFKVISLNKRFVPPYGTGATLYIRPVLFGSGAEIGVKPAKEYTFIIFVMPVGPYSKGGVKPIDNYICREYDRAAPLGTGNFKVGGNYAASMRAMEQAKNLGFASLIFLDAKKKKFIDECGHANFFGIKDNTYVTPKASKTILNSITNMSLETIAKSLGMKVERRDIPVEELSTFTEAGACGTAAVITPVKRIIDPDTKNVYEYCKNDEPGPWTIKLYNKLVGIQHGDEPDEFGWMTTVE